MGKMSQGRVIRFPVERRGWADRASVATEGNLALATLAEGFSAGPLSAPETYEERIVLRVLVILLGAPTSTTNYTYLASWNLE